MPGEVSPAMRDSRSFDELAFVGDTLFWVESRSEASGVRTLLRWRAPEGGGDVTPAGFDVASDIHAYGGGVYAVSAHGTWCVRDGSTIVRVDSEGGPRAIEVALRDRPSAYGDLTAASGELLCVSETVEGSQTGDSLLAIPMASGAAERVLVHATDGFLAAPRAGYSRLAWLRWDGDQMPWDATELVVAEYEAGGPLGREVVVAGGPGESVVEPRWGPEGDLYFVSDRTGWRNLYRWDGSQVRKVAPMAAECAAEPWELGYSSYSFLPDRRIVMAVQQGPKHWLAVVDLGGKVTRIDTPFTSLKPYVAAGRDSVAVIASSPVTAPQVVVVVLDASPAGVQVLTRPNPPQQQSPAISLPLEIAVRSSGRQVTALLYPPTGSRGGWRAPLIVRAHPGPNASSTLRLDWQVQFFTSRGFAVVDVDYAGSTGYGRAFRQSLYGRWGIDDVADCCAVARHLVSIGRADEDRVFIRGASAGGYTALKAVSGDTPFAAATALSAVVDPSRWAQRAPRFQRSHAARLASPAGAVRASTINRPVLLVHGRGDPIAPMDEIEALADGLSRAGVLHDLLIFGEGGHELARSVDAGAALEAELALYRGARRIPR